MGQARAERAFAPDVSRRVPAPMSEAERLEVRAIREGFEIVFLQFWPVREELLKLVERRRGFIIQPRRIGR